MPDTPDLVQLLYIWKSFCCKGRCAIAKFEIYRLRKQELSLLDFANENVVWKSLAPPGQ